MRLVAGWIATVAILAACSPAEPTSGQPTPPFASVSDAELGKCGVDSDEHDRLLGLDPDAFDQDPSGGWRAVADRAGCELAAATLLDEYIVANGVAPDEGVMWWHVGQLLASAGQNDDAVEWMMPTRGSEPSWSFYVDGTVAFLKGDEAALRTARDALAAVEVSDEDKALRRQFIEDNPDFVAPEGFVDDPPNLGVLDGLLACFGEPYSIAYGCEQRP